MKWRKRGGKSEMGGKSVVKIEAQDARRNLMESGKGGVTGVSTSRLRRRGHRQDF